MTWLIGYGLDNVYCLGVTKLEAFSSEEITEKYEKQDKIVGSNKQGVPWRSS